jgi:hypothetical protein
MTRPAFFFEFFIVDYPQDHFPTIKAGSNICHLGGSKPSKQASWFQKYNGTTKLPFCHFSNKQHEESCL